MKAYEIMSDLFSLANTGDYSHTCDTCKAGNSQVEVHKVAVTMFATPDVICRAAEWGAELLITHEPLYYNHMDKPSDEKVEGKKRSLIEETGLTIYRYHDFSHNTTEDIIIVGELRQMGVVGNIEYTKRLGLARICLTQPVTAIELARMLEERLKIKHLRICGATNIPSSRISLMVGMPGDILDELQNEQCEILLVGEACEWRHGEYARDAAQLGHNKTLIFMGHVGSERDGMKYTADILKCRYPELNVKYFECGEVYSYTN